MSGEERSIAARTVPLLAATRGQAVAAARAVLRHAGAGLAAAGAAFARRLDGGYAPSAGSETPSPLAPPQIELSALTVAYGRDIALEGVSGAFAPGSLTAVVGTNGAGKSTLLRAIAGILPPAAGRVSLDRAGPQGLAYLPQSDAVDREFPISAASFVALGAWREFGAFRAVEHRVTEAAAQALAAVGLAAAAHRPIGGLSVGQFRRVAFARLILQDAPVLLLDEPFAGVDATTTADLLALVARWHREGRTVIAVLHDLAQVRAHFPDALLLARRVVAWGPTAEALTSENRARAGYGASP
jgi:zinc/manganese transport system ATP-binding protein